VTTQATPAAVRPLVSLRTELLLATALLAAAAVAIAVVSVVLFAPLLASESAGLWLTALILGDVLVFVAFLRHQVERLVLRPLGDVVAASEAIAGGDLARRAPVGGSRELALLATSVNRLTDALLAEQAGRVRVEKMATVGRLAAGVAHEIGNPLGAVNGYVHILRGRVNGDGGAVEALDGLERESGRIDRIVRGLLDYARPRRPTPVPLDLNDVVQGATGLLADQGILRRITLALDLDPQPVRLVGERHELEQVLVNLLLNAVDATGGTGRLTVATRIADTGVLLAGIPRRAGDPEDVAIQRPPDARARLWLERRDPGSRVARLVVADSGAGVPAEDAERIFDPFFTTKEPGRGTGLGLAIVARIVDGLGGTVWVQRAREGGAAFHVLVPVAPAATSVRREAPAMTGARA
jgi:two-component system NtrC family sensor kinase